MTYRNFIAIVLASAIAVTGLTSAPARAGSDDTAKWVAGIAALAIIGAAIADDRNDDNGYYVGTRGRNHGHARDNRRHRRHDNARDNRRHRRHDNARDNRRHRHDSDRDNRRGNRHGYARHGRRALPAQCHTRVRARRGHVTGYGRRCLLNSYSQFNGLPHQCAVRVRGRGGHDRIVYSEACMHRNGYRH